MLIYPTTQNNTLSITNDTSSNVDVTTMSSDLINQRIFAKITVTDLNNNVLKLIKNENTNYHNAVVVKKLLNLTDIDNVVNSNSFTINEYVDNEDSSIILKKEHSITFNDTINNVFVYKPDLINNLDEIFEIS